MSNQEGSFAWVVSLARVVLFAGEAWLAVALISSVALAIPAITADPALGTVSRYVLAMAGCAIGMVALVVIYGVIDAIVSAEQSATNISARLTRIEPTLTDASSSLKTLTDLARLTEKVKAYIYREQEVEALREAARHHMAVQDYDAASTLIADMEDELGHTEEAERLRDELEASRKATQEEKVDAATARLQHMLDRHDWERATREAQRIMRLMPDSEKIAALPDRIEAARTAHKRQLLQAYGEAIRKNDVDRSIELLHQLDRYLTPQEAAALQESARGVFRAKLQNLGFQFTMCVADQRWAEAITTGEEIIRDYPNSRMAMEVREKMDLLKARATAGPTAQG